MFSPHHSLQLYPSDVHGQGTFKYTIICPKRYMSKTQEHLHHGCDAVKPIGFNMSPLCTGKKLCFSNNFMGSLSVMVDTTKKK